MPQITFFLHACSPQITRHGRFGGHMTSFEHAFSGAQSITHTPSTHVPFVQPSWQMAVDPSMLTIAASAVAPLSSSSLSSSSSPPLVVHARAPGIAHQPSRQT